jgi:hypothetical protein
MRPALFGCLEEGLGDLDLALEALDDPAAGRREGRSSGYRCGLVQRFLLLEACPLGGTCDQPFELVHAEQKRKVHKELERTSAFRLGGPARVQQNEPRPLPPAAQFSTGHRKSPPSVS